MTNRQPFISESYYKNLLSAYDSSDEHWNSHRLEEDFPGQEESIKAYEKKQDALCALIIRYTAGEPIAELNQPLEKVVVNFERYQKALADYEHAPNIAPLAIDGRPGNYGECLQVISLCILLQRSDLLKRFVALFDNAGYAGSDTLYEDLLSKGPPEAVQADRSLLRYRHRCGLVRQRLRAQRRQALRHCRRQGQRQRQEAKIYEQAR